MYLWSNTYLCLGVSKDVGPCVHGEVLCRRGAMEIYVAKMTNRSVLAGANPKDHQDSAIS
jgi:hypothetical protein